MNGMALHGGVIPYGGTFLIFSDYCRPAIRLAALMRQRVILALTHDSIGLGEDGPTHQPVEHLAALRAMPNLHVMRPADAIETAECWALALARADGPSVLSLSRQTVAPVRTDADGENRSARGAYVLAEAEGARQVTLLATGTEVGIALDARQRLAAAGIGCAVVSMPCWELFEAQDLTYRNAVLGDGLRSGDRGGSAVRLDPLRRQRGRRGRDDQLRRLGARRRALRAFRDHRRAGGRSGSDTPRRPRPGSVS